MAIDHIDDICQNQREDGFACFIEDFVRGWISLQEGLNVSHSGWEVLGDSSSVTVLHHNSVAIDLNTRLNSWYRGLPAEIISFEEFGEVCPHQPRLPWQCYRTKELLTGQR